MNLHLKFGACSSALRNNKILRTDIRFTNGTKWTQLRGNFNCLGSVNIKKGWQKVNPILLEILRNTILTCRFEQEVFLIFLHFGCTKWWTKINGKVLYAKHQWRFKIKLFSMLRAVYAFIKLWHNTHWLACVCVCVCM